MPVRDAEPADAAAIAAIGLVAVPETYRDLCEEGVVRSIVEQSYAPEALRACIARCAQADDAHFLVAERADRILGFLHYDCEGPEPELHRIYLDSAEKRKGIGSMLLGELHARLAAGSGYILMVIAANHPAVAFYRKHDSWTRPASTARATCTSGWASRFRPAPRRCRRSCSASPSRRDVDEEPRDRPRSARRVREHGGGNPPPRIVRTAERHAGVAAFE